MRSVGSSIIIFRCHYFTYSSAGLATNQFSVILVYQHPQFLEKEASKIDFLIVFLEPGTKFRSFKSSKKRLWKISFQLVYKEVHLELLPKRVAAFFCLQVTEVQKCYLVPNFEKYAFYSIFSSLLLFDRFFKKFTIYFSMQPTKSTEYR